MQIVIDIPEEYYNAIKAIPDRQCTADMLIIKTGTPLPKGHGRLKDVDWIDDYCPDYRTEDGAWCYKWEDIDNAPTIIEADTESEGKG